MGHPIVVRRFLIVGHRASTDPAFSLDDLAGAAGRMDILLNAANAALLLAHDLRRDVEVGLLLLGPPDPPRLVRLEAFRLRSYQPDIRSNAALVRRALQDASRIERETSPGVFGSKTTFEEALDRLGPSFVYAKEGGKDVREANLPADATFVFSDNQDLAAAEERTLTDRGALVIGLGPLTLHTDHAIAVLQNELDRRHV
ncbi:MAG TPA: tRNA (pseudouridine(54)-N(1))-methyltransferase TrmY [Thermoplasmata archaeon]|nr:tRNA (pseudouridine(54)-N(1))-methyltransferase TrmY [Thermoplasmata archaeon]